jgi:ABC-type oligopeptide transport system ATPase subunit
MNLASGFSNMPDTSLIESTEQAQATATPPLLELERLKMYFPVKGGVFMRAKKVCKAVDGVSLSINAGETLGLVGESGCGKSTLGKCIVRLIEATEGTVRFEGVTLNGLSRKLMKPIRKDLQMIFQDPVESLNARHTVRNLLEEPFIIHKMGDAAFRMKQVHELLEKVGLPASSANRFPFEFSGGQRQRIGIARAIVTSPFQRSMYPCKARS